MRRHREARSVRTHANAANYMNRQVLSEEHTRGARSEWTVSGVAERAWPTGLPTGPVSSECAPFATWRPLTGTFWYLSVSKNFPRISFTEMPDELEEFTVRLLPLGWTRGRVCLLRNCNQWKFHSNTEENHILKNYLIITSMAEKTAYIKSPPPVY